MKNRFPYLGGFTLVELAIVLVITGLIVGGVIGGLELVKQGNIRSAIADLNSFRTAHNVFTLKYDGIPGDFMNATEYWPGQTLPGDGNYEVDTSNEELLYWQHLVLSEILPGGYSGIDQFTQHVIGENVPAAPINGGGYAVYFLPLFNLVGHRFTLAGDDGSIDGSLLTPADARSIDLKMDDGLASTGKVVGQNGDNGTSSCLDPGNTYNLDDERLDCMIHFYFDD